MDVIRDGERPEWSPEISNLLGETRVGLLCLTPENLTAPWLLFEAGALSKTSDAYVWTFLHRVSPADVEQPLAQFQHTVAEKADVRRLMHTINQVVRDQNEKSLNEATLDKLFETFWPELKAGLSSVTDAGHQPPAELRTDREILEELLELVRSQEHRLSDISHSPSAPVSGSTWWRGVSPERQRSVIVLRMAIALNVPEVNAKAFVDMLRMQLPAAEFDLAIAPGTDRVTSIMVRFAQPITTSEEFLWRILARASESAGITIVNWRPETD